MAGRSPGLSGRGTRAKRAGVDGVAFCRVLGARRAEGALILQTKQSGRKNSWWLFARRALERSGSPRLRRAGHCSPYRSQDLRWAPCSLLAGKKPRLPSRPRTGASEPRRIPVSWSFFPSPQGRLSLEPEFQFSNCRLLKLSTLGPTWCPFPA
ncbi:unnamed protein product [Rangifer tarandus platyrhynchus]|uniref:Uncharacterized protein n=3 Tax=Rangifer tarandus platyrhynchus TaxID=3082113 RepID=A0ABN8ZPN0_RANTA|nr:unnamed protein product [Rangifer tarandus platyrhynchus]CAI9709528.1 unnamed protein product [Rangifer tarandus platyrhynchus]